MTTSREQIIENVLLKAQNMGAEETEVYLEHAVSAELSWRKQSLDKLKTEDSMGIGIRIKKDGKMGFSYTSDLRQTGMDRAVANAIENSRFGKPCTSVLLPKNMTYREPKTWDEHLQGKTLRRKIDLMEETEAYALGFDEAVKRLDSVEYEDGQSEFWLGDSEGTVLYKRGNYCCLSATAIAQRGEEHRSGYGVGLEMRWDCLSPKTVGEKAAKQAVGLLGAEQPDSGLTTLILSPDVARQLFGIIAGSFSGEAVWKHKSYLDGKLGQPIGGTSLTLIDDGTLDYRFGSGAFDGEGIPTCKTVLMNQGIVNGWLLDRETATKMNMEPTGNGRRDGYAGLPHVGTSNFYVAPGIQSPENLYGGLERGIYITGIMGAHTANPISGNVSLGAEGFLIEKGVLTKPLHRMTIAGNMLDFMAKVTDVGNDLEFLGSKGAPTIRMENIMVSGK